MWGVGKLLRWADGLGKVWPKCETRKHLRYGGMCSAFRVRCAFQGNVPRRTQTGGAWHVLELAGGMGYSPYWYLMTSTYHSQVGGTFEQCALETSSGTFIREVTIRLYCDFGISWISDSECLPGVRVGRYRRSLRLDHSSRT